MRIIDLTPKRGNPTTFETQYFVDNKQKPTNDASIQR